MSQARWVLRDSDPQIAAALQASLACPPAMASLLAGRGVTSASAPLFLAPTLDDLHSPDLLLGMPAAVARIRQAVALGEKS